MVISTGRLRFGPDNGRMLLRTGRAGVGSAVGHDLTIEVTDWSAQVDVPETGAADATVTAHVELGSLAVREGSGGARPLTDKDRGEIETNARRTLDVPHHPRATFDSTRVTTADDCTTVSGTLSLHGVTAPIDVQVREVAPDRYRATTVVTQSAYGIKPYSAFLGALKVRDDVQVEIEFRPGG
ncbi:YceI family protein [Micromonospora mangrovi]|uniref:YceI family protein n=2 Tax=Micromonospora TaxID=1873 RepID=A0AAU7MD32_9ACTN